MLEGLDFAKIQDLGSARECIKQLLNLVEELKADLDRLREENQRLRDENNRLKGERGKPEIKPNRTKKRDVSSENERHTPEDHTKGSKLDRIKIDRTEELEVDPKVLPADAEFKGYEDVVVQDIKVHTDNILFRKKKYYSASEGKSYLAALPPGYEGEFGPALKAWAITLYFGCNMSEPKILEFLSEAGVVISSGQLSNLLIKNQERFHGEKDAVYEAGLGSSPWQEIDDTSMRVNGQNQYCQIVCNPLYTAYFTTEDKTRQTVLDVRIETTKAKKANLLKVLEHPEISLHNNPAELGARQRVRKRDVSFGTRTNEGTKAWDTFMTLAATTKKLCVSFFKYIYDRISGAYHLPSLAHVIAQRAQELRLGASWNQGP